MNSEIQLAKRIWVSGQQFIGILYDVRCKMKYIIISFCISFVVVEPQSISAAMAIATTLKHVRVHKKCREHWVYNVYMYQYFLVLLFLRLFCWKFYLLRTVWSSNVWMDMRVWYVKWTQTVDTVHCAQCACSGLVWSFSIERFRKFARSTKQFWMLFQLHELIFRHIPRITNAQQHRIPGFKMLLLHVQWHGFSFEIFTFNKIVGTQRTYTTFSFTNNNLLIF